MESTFAGRFLFYSLIRTHRPSLSQLPSSTYQYTRHKPHHEIDSHAPGCHAGGQRLKILKHGPEAAHATETGHKRVQTAINHSDAVSPRRENIPVRISCKHQYAL